MKNIYPTRIGAFAFLSIIILLFSYPVFGQVGIGTTTPKEGSVFDVDSPDKGIYIPRISLTNATSLAPITGILTPTNAYGLMIYNTNPAMGAGLFVWTGTQWVSVGNGSNDDWKIGGNAATIPGTGVGQNYLGTNDVKDLVLGTQATERLRVLSNGQVSLNGLPLFGVDRFTVRAANNEFAVNGYTIGSGGAGVYGTNTTNGGTGIWGEAQAGIGVYGANLSGVGDGVFGNSSNIGVRGYGGVGAILEGGLNNGYGALTWNTTAVGANRTGLMAIGQNLLPFTFPGVGAILYGNSGGAGFADSATGTGLIGVGNGGTTAITIGSGIAGTGSNFGVFGLAVATSGARYGAYFAMNKAGNPTPVAADDPIALLAGYNGTDYFGGYFDGNQDNNPGGAGGNAGEDYAYVGIRTGGTTYKIIGTGSNSTMVNDNQGNKRILFSPEAPEILFEDYGTGQLINGKVDIQLDPLLKTVIHVSNSHPLKVFIQLEGNCNGVYVTNKSVKGFTVNELGGGSSNAPFSWHIVANREDTVLSDGTIASKHIGVRFPIGPEKIIAPVELSSNSKSHTNNINETIPLNYKKPLKSSAANTSETKISSDTLKSETNN